MKILDRISLLASIFPGTDRQRAERAAADMADRWADAFAREPEMAGDLIRLSGLFTVEPDYYHHDDHDETGAPLPRDPIRAAERRGAQEFALRLLAAGHMTPDEINDLMETST
ncbi:MAG: hypothetical protein AAFU41_00820 [Pseudomonadota bacterium]